MVEETDPIQKDGVRALYVSNSDFIVSQEYVFMEDGTLLSFKKVVKIDPSSSPFLNRQRCTPYQGCECILFPAVYRHTSPRRPSTDTQKRGEEHFGPTGS
jgi:hypothetical protein